MSPVAFVGSVLRRLSGVGLAKTAAALSFTTVLGLVPLFAIAFVYVARYPLFQSWLDALEKFLLRHMLPGSSSVVRTHLAEFTLKAANLQGVSIAFVTITALLLVATVEREINAIFRVREPRSLVHRAFVFAIGITAAPLLIGAAVWSTSWLLETSLETVPFASHAIGLAVTPLAVALATLAFTMLYALVPARPVRLGSAFVGGLFAALAFEGAKRGFAFYVTKFPTYQMMYGALATLPLFLLWVYVSWLVVLAGAAITATLAEGVPRRLRRRE
jgi:membrane protein